MARVLVAIAIAALGGSHAIAGPLMDRLRSADSVIIGEVVSGTSAGDTAQFVVNVTRVLKGSGPNGAVQVEFARRHDGRQPDFRIITGCRVFFLKRTDKTWTALPQVPRRAPIFSINEISYPADECSSGTTGPFVSPVESLNNDQLVAVMIASLETSAAEAGYIYRLFDSIGPDESPAVVEAAERLSRSGLTNLRLLGLAWRVSNQDSQAVTAIAAEFASLKTNDPLAGLPCAAIDRYTNTAPAGVEALGKIALQNQSFIGQAATRALQSIHTTAALPYLVRLLDSPNEQVRLDAIAGLSMFLLKMPTLPNDGKSYTVFERGLNPATRTPLSADENRHVHFGRVDSPEQEAELIRWWKAWWLARRQGGQ